MRLKPVGQLIKACVMEAIWWLFVFVVLSCYLTRDEMSDNGFEWYIVIKYTQQDWFGEQIDAHYVQTSSEALRLTAVGPMKPGELLRGFWVSNMNQRGKAIKLHEQRRFANRQWEMFMRHIDEQWKNAGEKEASK